ncbi:Proteoglycan 4 (Lubricin) (Megakaryocyte-stimulating factor) (Superficial zone proteoglycan) [Cleaved into: Proteoglycan 4 C-terminal part] [Durusdinium trenchii]|uniref:Proteoglycan 4 (Lubricin) (Megakaryocyte-stimulating factor) (Superficial zone proteoglycan) [Cleaved into: Proteoglycan 4 C-terminal part] n=1 Tax=Durusdinium trenchii TaxID=1381693 RepID=A0ABP0PLR8_9DINO
MDQVFKATAWQEPILDVDTATRFVTTLRSKCWVARCIISEEPAYQNRPARNLLQLISLQEQKHTFTGTSKPLFSLQSGPSRPGIPAITLRDVKVDAARQVSGQDDREIEFAEFVVQLRGVPTQDSKETEQGVRICFICEDVGDVQSGTTSALCWVLNMQDMWQGARMQSDSLLRVVAQPQVQGRQIVRWQALFSVAITKQDIDFWRQRKAWQASSPGDNAKKRVAEQIALATPNTKYNKVAAELRSPGYGALEEACELQNYLRPRGLSSGEAGCRTIEERRRNGTTLEPPVGRWALAVSCHWLEGHVQVYSDDEFNEKQASTIGPSAQLGDRRIRGPWCGRGSASMIDLPMDESKVPDAKDASELTCVDFKTKFMQVRGKKLKLALWVSRWVSHPGRKMLEGAEPSSDVFTHCPLKEGTREGTTPQQLEVDLGKERMLPEPASMHLAPRRWTRSASLGLGLLGTALIGTIGVIVLKSKTSGGVSSSVADPTKEYSMVSSHGFMGGVKSFAHSSIAMPGLPQFHQGSHVTHVHHFHSFGTPVDSSFGMPVDQVSYGDSSMVGDSSATGYSTVGDVDSSVTGDSSSLGVPADQVNYGASSFGVPADQVDYGASSFSVPADQVNYGDSVAMPSDMNQVHYTAHGGSFAMPADMDQIHFGASSIVPGWTKNSLGGLEHHSVVDCTTVEEDASVAKLEMCCKYGKIGCKQLKKAKKAKAKKAETKEDDADDHDKDDHDDDHDQEKESAEEPSMAVEDVEEKEVQAEEPEKEAAEEPETEAAEEPEKEAAEEPETEAAKEPETEAAEEPEAEEPEKESADEPSMAVEDVEEKEVEAEEPEKESAEEPETESAKEPETAEKQAEAEEPEKESAEEPEAFVSVASLAGRSPWWTAAVDSAGIGRLKGASSPKPQRKSGTSDPNVSPSRVKPILIWVRRSSERYTEFHAVVPEFAENRTPQCYDCTQRSTFEHVKYWQDEVRRYSTNQDAILMLVSNKALSGSVTPVSPVSRGPSRTTSLKPSLSRFAKVDLPEVQVSRTEGEESRTQKVEHPCSTASQPTRQEFAFAQSMMFIETSAKTRSFCVPTDRVERAEVLALTPGQLWKRSVWRSSATRSATFNVYLVRHGESTWNSAAKRWDLWQMFSQVDHPLTEQGIQQAKRLRDAAAQDALWSQSRLFSSPLTRALQTTLLATAVAGSEGESPARSAKRLTLLPDAREIAWPLAGPDSRSRVLGEGVMARALEELRKVEATWTECTEEQSVVDASLVEKVWWNKFWESKTEMQERLKRLLQTIEPAMPGQSSVLVCHSLLIQRLFKDFAAPSLVKDPEKQQLLSGLRSRKLQNCGAVRLRLDTGQIHDVELAFGTKLV